jgi:hypothetical protein
MPTAQRVEVDQLELLATLALIRTHLPTARLAHLQRSTENDGYGFSLARVTDVAGHDLQLPSAVDDEVADHLCDLDWDGLVGESPRGDASWDVHTDWIPKRRQL